MARKEITQFFDDLSGTPLTEDEVQAIPFSLGKDNYIIDLSPENAEKFREALKPYTEVARKNVAPAPARRSRQWGQGSSRNNRAKEIRQWAMDQGKDIAARGKIPAEVIEAYEQAHS
ncbi:histone-like nucleoid-structuring protein Lsr2 [Corynebacterium mastitidis]|uniref:histone-like nucleoid-structuring protein Lsr2 n=1 Tax=Corynebacterium mastitidis TaxID=161890 RepID=UPI00036D5730|nr:Lsr2 family protein [Corynebacterium mastitidis]